MKAVFSVSISAAAAASIEEIVADVNSKQSSWVAAVPDVARDIRPFLGAYTHRDAEYEEPNVMEIPQAFRTASPDSFDSIEKWPACTVISNVRDQSACGSCWAFGSVSSFESRACIATGNDIKYSPEDVAFCSTAGNGCQGGNSAWNWFKTEGVVTGGDYTDAGSGATCYPYSLAPCAHHVPASTKYPTCPADEGSAQCKSACTDSGYSGSYDSDKVKATTAYSVRGEESIMQELSTNGPMYVAFDVYSDFETYSSGVYHATTSEYLGGHAVTMVGYGTLNGEKYWKIKNSWNEQWGDNGHFLIRRGSDECGIESQVSAGLVGPPTPTPPSPPTPSPAPSPTPACQDEEDSSYCDYVKQQAMCSLIGYNCLNTCDCCDSPSLCGGSVDV